MQKHKRILFLGFRCSGKSTISKEFGLKIGINVFDTDKEIEREQNKTINEISHNGQNWDKFRELEVKKLKELLNIDNIIISAGGGIGVNNIIFNNKYTFGDIQKQEILKNKDTLKILLWADDDIIAERLKQSKLVENDRPDLNGQTTNIEEYVANNLKIMHEREKNYREMADIIFNTNNSNTDENVENLIYIINDKYGGV